MMGLHHKLGDPPTEPLSLQRQIDFLKLEQRLLNADVKSLAKQIDMLNNRITDACGDQENHAAKVQNIVIDLSARLESLQKLFEYGIGARTNDQLKALEERINKLSECYQGQQTQLSYLEVDVPGNLASDFDYFKKLVRELEKKLDGLRSQWATEVSRGQRRDERLDGLEDRTWQKGIEKWVDNLLKRVAGLESDRAAWAADAAKAGAHPKFQELEKRLDEFIGHFERKTDGVQFSNQSITGRMNNLEKKIEFLQGVEDSLDLIEKRVNVISSAVTQHVASGIKDEKHLDSLEKKIDGLCEENAQLWTNAYNLEDETGDHLRDLEKKIDACRVAVHNLDTRVTTQAGIIWKLGERVDRLDGPFEGFEIEYGTTRADPWREQWDKLKKRFSPTRENELEERLTYKYLVQMMDEMEGEVGT